MHSRLSVIACILMLLSCHGLICEAAEKEVSIDEHVNAIKTLYSYIERDEIPTVQQFYDLMGHHNEFEFMFEGSDIESVTPEGYSVFFNYLHKNKNWFVDGSASGGYEIFISHPLEKIHDVVVYEVLTVHNERIVARVKIYATRYSDDVIQDGYICTIIINDKDIADMIKTYNPNPDLYR